MAELERCVIIERVRAGMRGAKLEGRQIGRSRLDVDREQVVHDRRSGMSLTQIAKKHGISRATVCRLMKELRGIPTPPFLRLLVNLHSKLGWWRALFSDADKRCRTKSDRTTQNHVKLQNIIAVTQVIFFASLVSTGVPQRGIPFLEDRQKADHGEQDELDLLLRSAD
jgi:plasmid maintenance system antidote protein VapI